MDRLFKRRLILINKVKVRIERNGNVIIRDLATGEMQDDLMKDIHTSEMVLAAYDFLKVQGDLKKGDIEFELEVKIDGKYYTDFDEN